METTSKWIRVSCGQWQHWNMKHLSIIIGIIAKSNGLCIQYIRFSINIEISNSEFHQKQTWIHIIYPMPMIRIECACLCSRTPAPELNDVPRFTLDESLRKAHNINVFCKHLIKELSTSPNWLIHLSLYNILLIIQIIMIPFRDSLQSGTTASVYYLISNSNNTNDTFWIKFITPMWNSCAWHSKCGMNSKSNIESTNSKHTRDVLWENMLSNG